MINSKKPEAAKFRVAVLGAGVIGLSTAVRLQQIRSDIQVDIIARQFHMQTTSCVAAGIFQVKSSRLPGESIERLRRWCAASTKHFYELARAGKSLESGVSLIPQVHLISQVQSLRDGPLDRPLYLDYAIGSRVLTSEELAHYGTINGKCMYVGGYASTIPICECEYYLPYLLGQFRDNGGIVTERSLTTLSDFLAENSGEASATGDSSGKHVHYDAVVNCLGLGAREFVPDPSLYALRGQVDRVRAGWLKFAIYGDNGVHVYPGREYVIVGGVRQRDNESLAFDPNDAWQIRERAYALIPALNGAKYVRTDVGLRPTRDEGVRLDAQRFGDVTVVHNYGHSSNGVSLSWGCAVDAAQLVSDSLTPQCSDSQQ